MAVQQNKKSPSKRGMHRAHDSLPGQVQRQQPAQAVPDQVHRPRRQGGDVLRHPVHALLRAAGHAGVVVAGDLMPGRAQPPPQQAQGEPAQPDAVQQDDVVGHGQECNGRQRGRGRPATTLQVNGTSG